MQEVLSKIERVCFECGSTTTRLKRNKKKDGTYSYHPQWYRKYKHQEIARGSKYGWICQHCYDDIKNPQYYMLNKGRILKSSTEYYNKNKLKVLEYHKDYYQLNKTEIGIKQKLITERNKEGVKETHHIWYWENKERQLSQNSYLRYDIRWRLFMILADGRPIRCVHCAYDTDIRALQIDHINGGGMNEIKHFGGNTPMFRYYINHPEEAKQKLQILCANCNRIKVYTNKEVYGEARLMLNINPEIVDIR